MLRHLGDGRPGSREERRPLGPVPLVASNLQNALLPDVAISHTR